MSLTPQIEGFVFFFKFRDSIRTRPTHFDGREKKGNGRNVNVRKTKTDTARRLPVPVRGTGRITDGGT